MRSARSSLFLVVLLLTLPALCPAQDSGFLANWLHQVSRIQAEQPGWVTPVATVTPRLEQEVRFDLFDQALPNGRDLVNIDGGKGLEFIPAQNVEVLVNAPPYLLRHNPEVPDGFGDASFLVKYRLLSANAEKGNYIVTAFLGASLPTGTNRNGALSAIVTPTIAAGKGWGRFDVQSTLGVGLPTGHANLIGHPLTFNSAFQYRVLGRVFPEVEVNSTFYHGGRLDGNKQVFITPGIVVGKLPIHDRVGLTLGAGFQIAASSYHAYNHALIVTIRMPF